MDSEPATGFRVVSQGLRALPHAPAPGTVIPATLTPLIGRDDEICRASDMLRRPDLRLLTITGPGGIGKTSFALRVATKVAPDFADGVRLIQLGAIQLPEQVEIALLQHFGLRALGVAPVRDLLVSELRSAEMLLLFDNFEHLLPAASLATTLLAECPRLKVLVTSRVLLRVSGEYLFPLAPLTLQTIGSNTELFPSSSVRLFAERAAAVNPDFALTPENAALVGEICSQLDGLPLAIELAAARTRHLPISALRDRLTQRLPLLTGGGRDQPDRLQTMRNAIGWSYDLLPPETRRLFQRLSPFNSGFSLEAAEAVGKDGTDGSVVFDQLAGLIDASLVQVTTESRGIERFSMLETIREFAAEMLAANGESDAAHSTHADYFLWLAESYCLADLLPDGDYAMWLLEREHANLRSAIGWLDQQPNRDRFFRIVTALGRFWSQQCHYREGRQWLLQAIGPDTPPDLNAKVLVHLGMIEFYLGSYEEADLHLAQGCDAAARLGHSFHHSLALLGLGVSAFMQGNHSAAERLLRESEQAAGAIADPRLAAIRSGMALSNLSDVLVELGRTEEAVAGSRRSFEQLQSAGYHQGLTLMFGQSGDFARDAGDFGQALALYRQGMQLAAERLGTFTHIEAVQALAIIAVSAGQAERAVRLLGASEAQRDRNGLHYRLAGNQVALDRAIAGARMALGEAGFAAARTAGRGLELAQIVVETQELFDLLAECQTAQSSRRAPNGPVLSPRERDVLGLLAAGQSNPAIAESLFISVRTVENHIAHIFTKLGVTSRTAAVVAGITAGLLELES